MLSIYLIKRYVADGRFDSLVEGLSENGLNLPQPLKVRLANSPAAAVAMGLRRLLELTYGPTPPAVMMIERLLDAQRPNGDVDGDPLATAAFIAALGAAVREKAVSPTAREMLMDAREHALAALTGMQDADGLFRFSEDRSEADRALTAGFVLWLLADDDAFRSHLRLADLLNWFEERQHALDGHADRYFRLARAVGDIATPNQSDLPWPLAAA